MASKAVMEKYAKLAVVSGVNDACNQCIRN